MRTYPRRTQKTEDEIEWLVGFIRDSGEISRKQIREITGWGEEQSRRLCNIACFDGKIEIARRGGSRKLEHIYRIRQETP